MEDLLNIGIALSAEKDHNRLLEMILTGARKITNADAGTTLYLCEKDGLVFKILQNRTMNTYLGGNGEPIDIPPVKLAKEYVSAYVALTGKSVNIPDVYNAEGFDFTGPRHYDKMTGYRTKSMLVVSMFSTRLRPMTARTRETCRWKEPCVYLVLWWKTENWTPIYSDSSKKAGHGRR
ncbi:MAG: GAF domain-containing protein [Bacillota bacterium]